MKLTIETLSHKPLEFYKELPGQFTGLRLPGAEVTSASGGFGELSMQEFDGGSFVIRYSVLQTKEAFSVNATSHHSGVHALIMLRNEINPTLENGSIKIAEGQFTIVHAHQPTLTLTFPGLKQYICFEAMLSGTFISSLLKDFPEASFLLNAPSPVLPQVWVNPARWTDKEVDEQIRYIFSYSDPEKWRRNYFKNRVWDIVWKLLALYLKDPADDPRAREEKEKAYAIQRYILDNLDKHALIKELAQKFTLSESSLKKLFSKVYGMGLHEYRIYERLKKAIQLLNEGMSVKEAAAQTGWRPADLIRAYNKVYGTTPGTIKKRKRE
jgi:AraC-like DNA-binding protein